MAGAELNGVLDMLRSARMEEQFRLLRAGTLLSELRSVVSVVHAVSKGTSLRLMFCIRSLAAPLRELLEAVLDQKKTADAWHQVPEFFYRYFIFRSATIRELRHFQQKFESLASYVEQQHTPYVGRRYGDDSSSARNKGALRDPMVGRSILSEKMVRILLADRTSADGLLVVPIIGGPGIGKTRLAKALLDDDRVKHKFRVRLWVPVTRRCCLEGILMMMISRKRRAEVACSLEDMVIHIGRKLSRGNYLVVLDDVWSDTEGRWLEIGTLIEGLPSNGIVVLTTRTPDIASKITTIPHTATAKPCYLQPLEQEFSSSFVAKWTATHHGDWPDELIDEAGMKIANKCGGVPLLLEYACRLLCQPLDMQFWQGFLEKPDNKIRPDMFWRELLAYIDNLPQDKFWQRFLWHVRDRGLPDGNVVLESASLSYQHLPVDLQTCFLYCSMFPSDYDFNAEELADLLAAEGYIPPIVTTAQRRGFLQQLLDECFYALQEHEHGGKSTYRMHKVLHIFAQDMDKISSIVRVDQVTQVKIKARTQRSIRRASLIVHPLTASFPSRLFVFKDLGALILVQQGTVCPSDQPRCEITEIPQAFFQSFRGLQVLSFRATMIRMFPTKFVRPSQVKYLDLSQTDIETIPSSISRFLFLQTLILSHCDKLKKLHGNTTKLARLQKLDIEGCCNIVELPRNMSKMKSLEYLNVLDCSSLTQLPNGIGQLKNLHTLLGYIVSYTTGSAMSELQSLENLRRLSMHSLEKVSDVLDARYARLQHMTNLESLSLRWNVDDANNSTQAYAVLETLQPHQHLEALEIVAYEGNKLPSWMTGTRPYLKSLVEIRLVNLRSCEKVLPPLGILPCLKVAEISGVETICSVNDNFYGYNGSFASLEKLTFSYMHNLEIWEQACKADMFPRLAEVVIIQCPKLRALHMELPSVEKLILWMNNKKLYSSNGGLRGVAKSLEYLSISFSEELLAPLDCEGLQDLGNLKKLEICGCHELTCVPLGLQHLSSLTSLTIDNCSKLESLPDWLENLPSLRHMCLSGCPNLCSIPEGLRGHPGITIYVEGCPNLQEESSPNFPAESLGKSVATQVNKGKEIMIEYD